MDGGGEYSSKEMEEWLRRKGIFIERTAKHTPQQNGKSERLNRTLLSMARSLLFQAGLPKRFWGEAKCHLRQLPS
jgi:transposase InsO family protein